MTIAFTGLLVIFSSYFKISAEFQRITTVNLEPKFMSMLDLHSPKLLSLFQVKKGALGERLRPQLSILHQVLLIKKFPCIYFKLLYKCRILYTAKNAFLAEYFFFFCLLSSTNI